MANYPSLFWLNPLPSWVFNPQTLAFLEVNLAATELYGYSREEFLKMTLKDIRPQEEIENLEKNIQNLHLDEAGKSEVWLHKTRRGELIHAELLARTITWNEKPARLVVLKDVSKQFESELALKHSEYNYRLLTESTDDLVMRFDRQFKHLYANKATIHFFGKEPEAFIGKTHYELGFKEEEISYWHNQMEMVFESGKNHQEITFIEEIGRYVDWSLIPEKAADGSIISVLSYSRDITELVETKNQLIKSEEELRAINAEKDKFVKILAHDLRSPFQGLISLSQALAENLSILTPEKVLDYSKRLNKLSVNLVSLVDNLLEWANLQGGKQLFNPEKLFAQKELETCLNALSETINTKNIELSVTIQDECVVFADGKMFQSILRNLLSNACKFTPRNGKVEVECRQNNLETILTVADSGIGMSENLRSKLFTLGEKTNRLGTENETSSGLGLILVKEYVEKHQGKVDVHSIPEHGSTFTIHFPWTETLSN